jgi:hypothetical protein
MTNAFIRKRKDERAASSEIYVSEAYVAVTSYRYQITHVRNEISGMAMLVGRKPVAR